MAASAQNGPILGGRENEPPTKAKANPPSAVSMNKTAVANETQPQRELQESMSRLNVSGPPVSKTLNEQAKTNIKRAGLRLDDDQTHVSLSSTKAPSLDGKSTTSGTTFALDEKESLRPDDSASTKAGEDEDSISGPASGAPNSRVGSEAGSRAVRDHFYESSENTGSGLHRPHPLSRKIVEGIIEEGPQTSQAALVPTMNAPQTLSRPTTTSSIPLTMDFVSREPDEKLFEALESPKDRFFLLRLEEDIISFIKGSLEPKIDLPPCNSFCRLLAHKLADYYALTHFVDNAVSSVTLYRTPYCRIPTPLSELAKARATNAPIIHPIVPPAMKIMRRPGTSKDSPNMDSGAGTTESSALPSKAGSEVGDDSQQGTGVASPTGSTAARDKASLTREEREARYKEKREEIFGPQTEDGDSAESNKEISRTSSRNEKKRKKARRDDDGFEARSQYNAYYPGMPFSVNSYEQAVNANAYFATFGTQPNAIANQSGMISMTMPQQYFHPGFPAMPNASGLTHMIVPNSTMNGYNNQSAAFNGHSQTFTQQSPSQFYAPVQHSASKGQKSPAIPPAAANTNMQMPRQSSQPAEQQWSSNGYSNSFQPNVPQQGFFPQPAPSVPYPYGQLPFQPTLHNGKPAHPLPGSYNRTAFNPQTRAFVPGASSVQQQPAAPASPTSFTGSPNAPVMRHAPMQVSNGSIYTSYSQTPSYPPILYSPSQNDHSQPKAPQTNNTTTTRKLPSQNSSTQASSHESPAPQQSSLSKWATPANLPPKPPPPETSGVHESQHSLPMNNHFGTSVQAVNGGQPMPSFHNGVYSMPGVGGP